MSDKQIEKSKQKGGFIQGLPIPLAQPTNTGGCCGASSSAGGCCGESVSGNGDCCGGSTSAGCCEETVSNTKVSTSSSCCG